MKRSVAARVGRAVLALALAAGALACSQETTSPATTSTTLATTPATTPPDTTTDATTGVPETTTTVTSTTVTTTTVTTDATTTTTTTETTSTVPAPARELVLRDGGIGSVTFGVDADGVVDYVSSILGAPTDDTDWLGPGDFSLCPGEALRRVEWGVLRLSFGDVSAYADGRRHVYAWQYGRVGELGEEPQGLRTEDGIGLGASVAELVEAYPDVQLYDGDAELNPPGFELDDDFFGFLTGIGDDDVVTEMFNGWFCGE